VGGDKDSLEGIAVFAKLASAEREALARRCVWRRFEAGRHILGHGEPSRDVFFVVEGRARARIYAANGRDVVLRDVPAGEMFGELGAIDGQERSASVEAVTATRVAILPHAVFLDVVTGHPALAAAMLRRLVGQLRVLSERVFEFSTLSVPRRVRAELLRLAELQPADGGSARIAPVPTQALLASRISTHREAVAREMSHLTEQGILARERGALVVRDVERLRRLLNEATEEG
jgi:CRP-like cAMP-binding protein